MQAGNDRQNHGESVGFNPVHYGLTGDGELLTVFTACAGPFSLR
jgi:hypothetical protein